MVSILMLSHNQTRFVEESVRSVMGQTYQDWELLFVDDSSNDGILQLLMQLRDEDDKGRMSYSGEQASRICVYQNVFKKGDMALLISIRRAEGL